MNSLHKAITDRIDSLADTLLEVSHAIHARPELAFEEFHACELLSRTLKDHDLPTQTGVFTLDTAFEAGLNAESLGPTVALLAEYDALPGIGHACGHNLIATAALGATLGLQAVQEQLPGRVRLIGTPAEEKGGGKELMARAGAFEAVDAAMMIHPAGLNLATMPCICVAEVEVIYHGRSAHASVSPHRGINALDGLLLAYQSISNLRQHIRDGERIHGIITEGGQAPNIVPERAVGDFYVRAADETALANLKPRVQACFEAGAKGSGCKVEINWAKVDYLDLNTNWPLADVFQKHGECLGREFLDWCGQHRHGQRKPPRARHSSAAGGGTPRRGHPQPGVRQVGRVGNGRCRGAGRRQTAGDDRCRFPDGRRTAQGQCRGIPHRQGSCLGACAAGIHGCTSVPHRCFVRSASPNGAESPLKSSVQGGR